MNIVRLDENVEDKIRAMLTALGEQEGRKYELCLVSAISEDGKISVFMGHSDMEKNQITGAEANPLLRAIGEWCFEIKRQNGEDV